MIRGYPKMSQMKHSILIGSDKGGVGKSLISQLVMLSFDRKRMPLRVIELDHQRKLSNDFPNRVDLSLDAGVSIAETLSNRFAAESFFNPVYEQWCADDSMTDLGANVTTKLFEWMEHCDIQGIAKEDNIHFRFVAVTNPDDQGLRSAVSSLDNARRALGPTAELFLILNDTVGTTGFAPYLHSDVWKQCMS